MQLANRGEGDVILREETAMHDEDFVIYHMTQWQQTKSFTEQLVKICIVLLDNLSLKTIEFVHVSGFVVTSCEVHVVRI